MPTNGPQMDHYRKRQEAIVRRKRRDEMAQMVSEEDLETIRDGAMLIDVYADEWPES